MSLVYLHIDMPLSYTVHCKYYKSPKNNYYLVSKVSYKKTLHVSAEGPFSGEVNIKYIKEGVIKL